MAGFCNLSNHINIFHWGNHNSLLTHIQCTSIPYYFTAINMSLLKTSKVFKVIYVYAISQHAIKFHVCRTGNKSRFYCFFIRYNRELSVWVTMLTQILDYVCQIKKILPSHNMVFATENRLWEEFYYVTQWLSLSVDYTSVWLTLPSQHFFPAVSVTT